MAQYSLSFVASTPEEIVANQADPIKALQAAATTGAKLVEVYVAGESGASTITELVINRPSSAGTYVTTQTPVPLNPFSAAASGVATYGSLSGGPPHTGASVDPTFSTADIINLTLNTFAGIVRWVAPPGSEILALGSGVEGELACLASRGGTGQVSGHVIYEQL
jgi:hypothetical protein